MKSVKQLLFCGIATSSLIAASHASAALIVYDPFDYETGAIERTGDQGDSASDIGFIGDWISPGGGVRGEVQAGNLTPSDAGHSNYPLLGNHLGTAGSGARDRAGRDLDVAAFAGSGLQGTSGVGDGVDGTMWMAYINQWTNDQAGRDMFVALGNDIGPDLNDEDTAGSLIVGVIADDDNLADQDNYGLYISDGNQQDSGGNWAVDISDIDAPEDVNDVILTRIDFSSTPGQDTAYLFVNPGETEPLIGDAAATVMGDFSAFDSLKVGIGNGRGIQFDEIRIASDFNSALGLPEESDDGDVVVPEPVTAALAGFGGLALIARRRRHA